MAGPQEGGLPVPTQSASPSLRLLYFLASQRALLLLFSDGTVQVSKGPHPQEPLGGGVSSLGASLSPGLCWLFQCTLLGGLQEIAGSWQEGKV